MMQSREKRVKEEHEQRWATDSFLSRILPPGAAQTPRGGTEGLAGDRISAQNSKGQ